MNVLAKFGLCGLLLLAQTPQTAPPAKAPPPGRKPPVRQDQTEDGSDAIKPTARARPLASIRLGGVYTLGLGENAAPMEESAKLGAKLSEENRRWITEHCDLIALNAVNIEPDTFPKIVKAQP